MSSYKVDRRVFVFAMLALAGCGFTPAFGPDGKAAALRNSIAFEAPNSRDAFDFVEHMERRIGHATTATLQLTYDLKVRRAGVGVTPSQELIRYNLVGDVSYAVRRLSDNRLLTSGKADTFTGYTVDAIDTTASPPRTSSTISTLAAQRDARTRLMVALADLVVTQLIATAPDWAE